MTPSPWAIVLVVPATLIRPLVPANPSRPPRGPDSLHEPKWDGVRFQVIKDGDRVRLHSKSGAEYTNRLPNTVDAFKSMPTRSAVLDVYTRTIK